MNLYEMIRGMVEVLSRYTVLRFYFQFLKPPMLKCSFPFVKYAFLSFLKSLCNNVRFF